MQVALISIGNCPSLALRNLQRYALAQDDLRGQVDFRLYDYDIREFEQSRIQSSRKWSFVTKFDETLEDIKKTRPALVAFSCYMWNIELSIHMAHLIKRVLPSATIVLGGPDPGPRAHEILRLHAHVDVVVEGDGELPFVGILRQLVRPGGPDFMQVPQLRFRKGGAVVASADSDLQPDMKLLYGVYASPPSPETMASWFWPHVLYETQRGCPYSCSYCMYGKTKVSTKDPAIVADELTALLQTGLRVELIDPTFSTYVTRAKQILRLLGEREYSGTLYFEAYPDSIDEEMAELLARARVASIGLGFQTLSSEGLKAVARPKNLARFERAVELLKQRGISFYVDIIYGLPQTTVKDFFETVDYLYRVGVEEIVTYRLLGLPGSPMLEDVGKYGLVFADAPPYELLESRTFSHEELMFCERFAQTHDVVRAQLPAKLLAQLTQMLGGMSALVCELMKREFSRNATADDVAAIFAAIMLGPSRTAAVVGSSAPDAASHGGVRRQLPVLVSHTAQDERDDRGRPDDRTHQR